MADLWPFIAPSADQVDVFLGYLAARWEAKVLDHLDGIRFDEQTRRILIDLKPSGEAVLRADVYIPVAEGKESEAQTVVRDLQKMAEKGKVPADLAQKIVTCTELRALQDPNTMRRTAEFRVLLRQWLPTVPIKKK